MSTTGTMPAMEVSARTLREVEFREKLRGYHPDDVDEFLERVAAGIELLQDKLREAIERANRVERTAATAPPPDEDDKVKRTLALAQRTADLTVQEAREQAVQLLQQAQDEAQRIVSAAEHQATAVIEAGQAQLRGDIVRLESARLRASGDLEALSQFLEQERARLRQALADAQARLDQVVPAVAAPPVFPPLDLPPEGLAPPPVALA